MNRFFPVSLIGFAAAPALTKNFDCSRGNEADDVSPETLWGTSLNE